MKQKPNGPYNNQIINNNQMETVKLTMDFNVPEEPTKIYIDGTTEEPIDEINKELLYNSIVLQCAQSLMNLELHEVIAIDINTKDSYTFDVETQGQAISDNLKACVQYYHERGMIYQAEQAYQLYILSGGKPTV